MTDGLPSGWQVWNEEEGGRLVLAYRPDVFDSSAFPPACLPTITVAPGDSPDQLAERRARAADGRYDERDDAVVAAKELAERFVSGEVDYRGVYQQPRDAYLDRLDELVAGEE